MISAILLAAGRSSRYPGNKLLVPLRGRPLVLHTLEALASCPFDELLVVLGHDAQVIRPLLEGYPCRWVLNPDYESGMSGSIRAGLKALHSESAGVLICLGDMPLLRPAALHRLCQAFRSNPERITAPLAAGRQANPVIIPRCYWPEIETLRGDVGCKGIIERHPREITYVPLPMLGVLQDADTPEAMNLLRLRLEQPLTEMTVLVRGAGEMASGVAHRLTRVGFKVCMTELAQPLAIRRSVCFSEAVHDGSCEVEGITGQRVDSLEEIHECWRLGIVPVLVDPAAAIREPLRPDVVVDGIMGKRNTGTQLDHAPLVIGLGPGFEAGRDAHVVVETNRGHRLGSLVERGAAEPDTGQPGIITGYGEERVIKSPAGGLFLTHLNPGVNVAENEVLGSVNGIPLRSRISGALRGILRSHTQVAAGMKLADIDPRNEISYCCSISDKARTISGTVLEAILMYYNL
jgi:xanthine dehydrogenase accessory factor